MKKQITVSQAGVEFLFSIVDTNPAKDRKAVKMTNSILQQLKEPMNNSTTFRNETRKKYLKDVDDGKGGTKKDVPQEDQEAFGEEVLAGMNKMIDLQFDRESFSWLKADLLENVFTTNPNLQNGIAGSLHMRLFDEIMTAIENAQEVK